MQAQNNPNKPSPPPAPPPGKSPVKEPVPDGNDRPPQMEFAPQFLSRPRAEHCRPH